MIITVSGLPGSGTTTAARLLAQKTGMDMISSGEVFRKMAEERKMSLEDFGDLAEKNEEIDKKLDRSMIERAKKGTILEGRLTGHLLNNSEKEAYKIWLRAPLDVRINRIADREEIKDKDALKKRVVKREKSERKRYQQYYDIDLTDISIYDNIIDSEKNSPEEIVEMIIEGVRDETCQE
ncbi:MAG: AAA family ATPase [Candidatus Thermoplasmatota archaeon]|nr:AAA family ATPase [Candidatus Thermoplasmatota archaeon]MBS3789849.1 AAA family ATPase [Candidatus Thermoplasmatota archaeon]